MNIEEQNLQRFLSRVMQDYKGDRSSLEESVGAVVLLIEAVLEDDVAAVRMWLDSTRDRNPQETLSSS